MFDLVVRNGLVVDGTGEPARRADIAISDGRIVEIGAIAAGAATQEIDAAGLVVAPGFIDLHTHYDAQGLLGSAADPVLPARCDHRHRRHCGLTLAPVKPADKDFLTRLLARVEAIRWIRCAPAFPMAGRGYPEMLDSVAKLPLGLNIGLMVGHSALRRAVMGEAASERAATLGRDRGDVPAARRGARRRWHRLFDPPMSRPRSMATAGRRREFCHHRGIRRPRRGLLALSRHPSLEFIPNSFLAGFSDEDMELMADMSARPTARSTGTRR